MSLCVVGVVQRPPAAEDGMAHLGDELHSPGQPKVVARNQQPHSFDRMWAVAPLEVGNRHRHLRSGLGAQLGRWGALVVSADG